MKFFKINSNNFAVIIIFILTFIVGLLTFKDYGIGIDDKFQRLSGFYWLNYILSFTDLNELKELTLIKLNAISGPTLPSIEYYNRYGILFDVPAAFLEIIFNINDTKNYYLFRHFLNFLYFFIGSIFFYKILKNRFDNFTSLCGTAMFILSPRIYGDSFYNMKDIIFLSFLSIALFYCFEFFKKNNYTNLIFFSLFSAMCIQMRVLGIFIPLAFLGFYILSLISNKEEIKKIFQYFLYLLFTIFFLYLLWPYLWEDPLKNFLINFSYADSIPGGMKIFFKGEFISIKFMPYDYILTWIIISTPIIHIALFFIGFIFIFQRLIKRLFTFENIKIKKYDLWRNYNEKKDLFVFICLIVIVSSLTILNISLLNTWKYLYFLNIFIVYIGSYSIYFLINKFKKNNKIKVFKIFIICSFIFVAARMVQYHPYQGLYFNVLLSGKYKNNFDIDYTALSGKYALKQMLDLENNKKVINIGVASWTPLERSKEMLDKKLRSKINIVGQNYSLADYIYTNNISEVDKKLNNKYDIPNNFIKIYNLIIDDLVIYEIYKKT